MQTVQVKLLNDGNLRGAKDVKFPVVVDGSIDHDRVWCDVSSDELIRVGLIKEARKWSFPFRIGSECEVVS